MSFFNNKHIVMAMIVAPVLAVMAYLSVDSLVKEQPHAAVAGQAYPLVAQSNCRYSSGHCDLQNSGFLATLSVGSGDAKGQRHLLLKTSHPVAAATIGFVQQSGIELPPRAMTENHHEVDNSLKPNNSLEQNKSPAQIEKIKPTGPNDTQVWRVDVPASVTERGSVRLVLQANNTSYFADTGLTFILYQTAFDEDFRRQD